MAKTFYFIYFDVIHEFNPTYEVQNIENGVFYSASFANGCFQNGVTIASVYGLFSQNSRKFKKSQNMIIDFEI